MARCTHTMTPSVVERLRDHLVAEQLAGAEHLTHRGDDGEDPGVAQTVADAVEQAAPRTVLHRVGLEAANHDAVRDDEADEDRQLLAEVEHVGAQQLVEHDHHARHDHELHDDADLAGDEVAQQGDDHVGHRGDERHADAHDDRLVEPRGDGERGADAEHLQRDRVVVPQRVEDGFLLVLAEQRLGGGGRGGGGGHVSSSRGRGRTPAGPA
jgi:hypothetical protein